MFEGQRMLLRGRKTARRTDPQEIQILRSAIQPGDAVFDVGANKGGYLACLARAVGRTGLVVAFEPIPSLATRLTTATKQLRWSHVEVCAAAASDCDGKAMLATPEGTHHWESSLEHNASPGATTQEVATVRLDRYIGRLGNRSLSAIKIDVEGHESAVIRGGHTLLKRHKPLLVVEVEARHRPDRDPKVFFEEMEALGYRGWFVDHNHTRRAVSEFDTDRDQSADGPVINNFIFEPA